MQNAALALDLLFLPRCRQTRITDLAFPCRSISKTMNSSGALGTFPHTKRRWGVRLTPLCSGERGSGRDSGCWRRTAAAVPAPHGPLRSRSAQRGAEGGAAAGGAGPVSMAPGWRAGAERCFRSPPDVAARAAQLRGASLPERGAGLLATAVPLPPSPSSSSPPPPPAALPLSARPLGLTGECGAAPPRPFPVASAGCGPSAIFPPAATPAAGSGSPRAAAGLGGGGSGCYLRVASDVIP